MTDQQWQDLLQILAGEQPAKPPIGFIIDSPWLPGWSGMSTLDYYTSDELWLRANLRAINTFPDVMFLPGFWSEYGMCTEPSAFGSRLVWAEQNLPHADQVLASLEQIPGLQQPRVTTDGLLPFMINRLKLTQPHIQQTGHNIRFAIARGPLNIASFLMGTTEFLTTMMMDSDKAHDLLGKITDFIISWLEYQRITFPTIDGIFILDDIVGFVGDQECQDFVVPYLTKIFAAFKASVRFFHNDAQGLVCAPYLEGMGINLFNFSFNHTMQEMRGLVGDNVTLLGNVPPRDILAQGSAQDVTKSVCAMVDSIQDKRRIIWSCGGGMPPEVSTENINAFIAAIKDYVK